MQSAPSGAQQRRVWRGGAARNRPAVIRLPRNPDLGVLSPVTKRTFQPNNRRRHKTHGFRLRMRTRAGRAIIGNRRRKGRDRLAA